MFVMLIPRIEVFTHTIQLNFSSVFFRKNIFVLFLRFKILNLTLGHLK